ncbi:MAG: type II toxin-antitoxin system RelB/DinJ family antitoxin [Candidatus Bipolaricaulota bacterium]|nr:type II toxin-antitoxin system RelB/DinJ family antitoxin [Candidatus Bipolaricaulota bacterium]
MAKTSAVHARIEPELKNETEEVFRHLGLSVTQAITLFYKQVQMRKGLPFDVIIPNEATLKTFEDTDAGRNITVCENPEDMFNKLGV